MDATHERLVENGVAENVGYNNMGNIKHYEYFCKGCERSFRFATLNPDITRLPKWFRAIAESFQ